MTTTLSEAILKNIKSEDANTGLAVAALIMAEANRRGHLAGGVQSIQWDRNQGIGVLVDDAGQRQHLANALSLSPTVMERSVRYPAPGKGYLRSGTFAGYQVTIWNFEA